MGLSFGVAFVTVFRSRSWDSPLYHHRSLKDQHQHTCHISPNTRVFVHGQFTWESVLQSAAVAPNGHKLSLYWSSKDQSTQPNPNSLVYNLAECCRRVSRLLSGPWEPKFRCQLDKDLFCVVNQRAGESTEQHEHEQRHGRPV